MWQDFLRALDSVGKHVFTAKTQAGQITTLCEALTASGKCKKAFKEANPTTASEFRALFTQLVSGLGSEPLTTPQKNKITAIGERMHVPFLSAVWNRMITGSKASSHLVLAKVDYGDLLLEAAG